MNLNISKLLLILLKSKCTDKIASLFQVIFMEFSLYLKGFMTGPYVDSNLRENNSILITIYIKQKLCAFSRLYWLHDDLFSCICSLYDGHSLDVSTDQACVVNAFSFPMFRKYFAIQYSLNCKAFKVSFLANSSTGLDMQFRLRICYFIYFRKILENVRNGEL